MLALALFVLPCAWARAQVGLGEAGLAAASAMLVALALIGLVAWGALCGTLMFVWPRLQRDAPRPSFKRAALQALAGLMLILLLLWLGGLFVSFRNSVEREEPDAKPAPPAFLLTTRAEGSVPCQQHGCAQRTFLSPAGEALAGLSYCVKDPSGKLIAQGVTDQYGVAVYMGKIPGERIGIDHCWLELDVN